MYGLLGYLLFANLIYGLSILLDWMGGEPIVGDWVRVPYLLSYRNGFVRRGLIGTLFHLLGIHPDRTVILITYTVAFEIFIVLFHLFVRREGKGNPLLRYLLLLFLLSPATVLHVGDDVGRTDIYLYLILLLSLFSAGISPLLTAVAILIHEGYVLLALPTLLTYHLIKGRKALAIANAAVGVLVAISVSKVGTLGPADFSLYARILSGNGITTTDPLLPLASSPLRNALHFYGQFLSSPPLLRAFLLGVGLSISLVALHFLLFYRTLRGPSLLKLSPLLPLAMFLFGIDYFRWAFASSLSMALLWSVMAGKYGTTPPGRMERVLFLLSLLSFPLEVLREVYLRAL